MVWIVFGALTLGLLFIYVPVFATGGAGVSTGARSVDQAARGASIGARHVPSGYTASRGLRFGGFVLDGVLWMLVGLPYQLSGESSTGALVSLVLWFGLIVTQIVLISTSGQSIGKKMVGTRIVEYDSGETVGFYRGVLLRSWLVTLLYLIPVVNLIFGIANPLWIFGVERRCLHDHIAGTRVVEA